MINKRILDLSCNKEEFDKVKSVYESALEDSGHFLSKSYDNSNTQNARRNINREVKQFNPPYTTFRKILPVWKSFQNKNMPVYVRMTHNKIHSTLFKMQENIAIKKYFHQKRYGQIICGAGLLPKSNFEGCLDRSEMTGTKKEQSF